MQVWSSTRNDFLEKDVTLRLRLRKFTNYEYVPSEQAGLPTSRHGGGGGGGKKRRSTDSKNNIVLTCAKVHTDATEVSPTYPQPPAVLYVSTSLPIT
jgi:hypothetical protein